MDLEHNENEELEVTPAEPEAAPEAEPETAPVPEAEPEEKPEEKSAEKKPGMSKGAKIAIFLAALALVAAIAACVLLITGRKDHPAGTEAQQTEATEATDGTTETVADKTLEAGEEVTTTYGKAANLIDADNFGKNAVTDNAAYTTSTAEAGDVQMRTAVARDATGYCLTNADLQIYYWMEFYQLMNNYGSYASMLGLDYTKALALQDAPSGGTWEQYFLTSATNNFAEIRALYLAAQEAGYELPETEAKSIEDVLDPEGSFAKSAADNGYDDVDAYLQVNFGKGVTTEIYHDYLLTYYTAVNYYKNVLYGESANALTDAEVEAYYDENAQSYIDQGVTKVNNVSVRHILIQPEGEQDEEGNYSDEAWTAAEQKANEVLQEWEAGDKTEERFGELAQKYSADGSATSGGLYENVYPGQMVTEFNDWCFADGRGAGDYGLVKTEYGYHIIYFCAASEQVYWYETAKADLQRERASQLEQDAMDEFDFSEDLTQAAIFDVLAESRAQNAAAQAEAEAAQSETTDNADASATDEP